MIKRLICSLSLLILCFAIGIGSYIYIENTTDELTRDFNKVSDLVREEQYNEALESVKKSQELWDKHKTWYNVFLDYSLFEALEINIPMIKDLIESESYDYANTKLLEIIETFNSILHEQKISFGNIL